MAYMARLPGIREALKSQLSDEAVRIGKLNDEMNELRSAYKRYVELFEEYDRRADRIRTTLGLLEGDPEFDPWNSEDYPKYVDKSLTERRKNPLWKFVREVVRQVPELQVVELETLLNGLGMKTSRQAVEAAISGHPDVFRTRKHKRNKFISLKGAY